MDLEDSLEDVQLQEYKYKINKFKQDRLSPIVSGLCFIMGAYILLLR